MNTHHRLTGRRMEGMGIGGLGGLLPPAVAGAVGGHVATRNGKREQGTDVLAGLQAIKSAIDKQTDYLTRYLAQAVDEIDAHIYEWTTEPLPVGDQFHTLTVLPQTRQLEQIDSVFVAIVNPTQAAGLTMTIDNAWAKLGPVYVNLNAIVNSAAGTGGAIPIPLGLLLESYNTRQFTIHATAPFAAGWYMSAALIGKAIPATLGEVLT